ncbi:MAG: Eco57I restriction-modification methylase domain-containing protein, partial [Byssovorax sp.]
MNSDTYKALLKSLQKLEKAIAKAGIASVRADERLRKRVAALHVVSETGGSLDDYTKLLAGRSAVQLLLRTVYVRVLEDLGLLDPPRLGGDRGYDAFHAVAPSLGVRAYFKWVFRDLAEDFPALFTPLTEELPLPSEEICAEVWKLWHDKDGKGILIYDWSSGDFDSHFLGDLYQDLDADVRERYALLQTPDFVEEYILDHTLTPAVIEFDPRRSRDRGEAFRLIDPTCGSGHFLIGAFRRLADYWQKEQNCKPWEASFRALESVWGCDINSYAVAVARFRLLLEVMQRTGISSMEKLSGLVFNLRTMDSLVPWEGPKGQGAQVELFEAQGRLAKYATAQEREENANFLRRGFQVVVGNPPYITPKDPQKRDDYRVFWPNSATGKYGLIAPFVERFFSLGAPGAFVGQITGNAFTKREYGVALVTRVLPQWHVTDIVDTSGAYIPGHGTPTIVLFGRSLHAGNTPIRCVGGKRGEPRVRGRRQ